MKEQSILYFGFAAGMAWLQAGITYGTPNRLCNAVCCGMAPALLAAALVPLTYAGVRYAKRRSPPTRGASTGSATCATAATATGWYVLGAWMATIAITLKLSPLVCLCLCGECHRLDRTAVGGCSFFFGLLGAAAGAVIVIAGEMPELAGAGVQRLVPGGGEIQSG